MKQKLGKFCYFIISGSLIVIGVIVKYFLIDTNLGAQFKNFNHELLSSDIIFICAILFAIIGLIFYAIRKSSKSTLKDSTILLSALLISPLTLVLALTPFLTTLYPGEVGDNIFASLFGFVAIIGTFTAFAWIILLIITFIKQTLTIFTRN